MKKLAITGITKSFRLHDRTVIALNDVSLTVEPQEFFILLGPSGCGKSTLLNSVAGLEIPESGEISLESTVLFSAARRCSLSPRERNVAMVFQSYALYPHMTVAQNIGFPLKVRRMDKKEREGKVMESAKMLQIEHLLAAKPAELSGGQRQRVAIARALVRQPELFLLDEPLSNLDAQLRSAMRNHLKVLQNRLGITTLYVTHDQIEAMTLGDRIAVMRSGKIEQIGTPDELYRKPANAFVASFIGTPPMNLLAAEMEINARCVRVRAAGEMFDCSPEKVVPSGKRGIQKGFLGIRPEHIQLCEADTPNNVAVTVTGYERMGRETVLFGKCGNGEVTLLAGTVNPSIGDTAWIYFPADRLYCFVE